MLRWLYGEVEPVASLRNAFFRSLDNSRGTVGTTIELPQRLPRTHTALRIEDAVLVALRELVVQSAIGWDTLPAP